MAKKRLTRDKVISVVNGKALVGIYWEGTDVGSPTARKKNVGSPTTRKRRRRMVQKSCLSAVLRRLTG